MDFVYWRHPTVPGIKVEEVTGGEHYQGKVWLEMARQVYCENGREEYREIGHFKNGAPFLYGYSGRISVTHCQGMLAVATLPQTPEVKLDVYSDRAALGIDAERLDREQVLRVRERYLSETELALISEDDLQSNVMAWTIKEAAYKAALADGVDFRRDIAITSMPRLAPPTPVFDSAEFGLPKSCDKLPEDFFGEARVSTAEGERIFRIFTYISEDCVVTLAYSARCAKFGKNMSK